VKSLNHGLGYLVVDHRDSPGLTAADVAHIPGAVAVGAGQVYECDMAQCGHCAREVRLNPGRVRHREVCPYCFHYVCDSCHAMRVKTGQCIPHVALVDAAQNVLEGGQVDPHWREALVNVL
jgi:hypothetical protein